MADAAVLAAIASPRRREILRLIWTGEMQAGAIAGAMPDVTFGAVSLQLRALIEAGNAGTARTANASHTSPPRWSGCGTTHCGG